MNIVSFLLGALCGVLAVVIIASISAYKEMKLKKDMIGSLVINSLNTTPEKPVAKKTTRKTTKKGE